MLYNIIVFFIKNTAVNIIIGFLVVALMQVALYILMLPSFKKVTPYIKSGWWGFYAIGDARLCPTDDPDDEYLATRLFRSVQEWVLLEI